MMSNKDIEIWILVTLSTSHKTLGVNPADMYYRKPEIIDINLDKFMNILKRLQDNEYVSRSSILGGHICVTGKGEKELNKRMDKLKTEKQEKYVSLISLSPIYELKERVTTIEKIILYTFMGGMFLYIFTISQQNMNSILKMGWATVTILFFFHSIINFTTLILFAKRGIRERILEKFWDIIDKNEKLIFYIIIISIVISGSYILNKSFEFKIEMIIGAVILGILVNIILNCRRLQNKFSQFKKRMKKRYSK